MGAVPPVPQAPFSVAVEHEPEKIVAHCKGQLTSHHTELLKEAVKPLLSQTPAVRIDLSQVEYVDSAGLGMLISLYMSGRKAGCELKLVNFNDRIRDLLRITNLLWVLV